MKKNFYAILVILGGACWGLVSIFITPLSKAGLSSMEISLLRSVVATPLFLIIALIKDKSLFRIKLKDLWIFVLIGLFEGVLFNILYFYTITHSEPSIAVMLLYTAPIFVMIESKIIFKEKATPNKIASMFLTILGCVFVAGVFGEAKSLPTLVLVTGLLTGLTYGSFTVALRSATQKYDSLTVNVYSFLFGTILMIPFGNPKHVFSLVIENPKLILWAAGLGITCSVFANMVFTKGISRVEAAVASILAASEPLTATIVGIVIFKDSTNVFKIVGILLIFLAIVIQSDYFVQKNKQRL